MRNLEGIKKVIIKVGTSTLTHNNGNLNLKRIEELVRVIADIKNSDKDVVLVTSGAIGVGVSKLKLESRPSDVKRKQALAAVGQSILMGVYKKLFNEYNQTVGQMLITKEVITNEKMFENVKNCFSALFDYGVIPIVNENDSVTVDEILFGDNDTLSAYVANIIKADLLILLTDVDGLYDKNPNEQGAKLIPCVTEITDKIRSIAGGTVTSNGTGGMATKITAAEIAAKSKTRTVIINGTNPSLIHDIMNNKDAGTFFDIKGACK